MDALTVFALALALALDAFAVAVAAGLRRCSRREALLLAGTFGLFQFCMPVAGWFLGEGIQPWIASWDHWLAFFLLAAVGLKMIREGWTGRTRQALGGGDLLALGLATSLDALAAGLSLALLRAAVWGPALAIGAVCFCLTLCGAGLGRLLCRLPGPGRAVGARSGILGGLTLLAIGFGLLREHGVW
ncbi:MAG: manganese efflux pump MntP family protein [Desulfovibrio sp.]|jgi:putative Mn2+ efflux pump MntP|nr:manganese efflux pump MntP family protein [Desulfovibrio sp.]